MAHAEIDKNGNGQRGRGTSKTPVVGAKERFSGSVRAVLTKPDDQNSRLIGIRMLNIIRDVCYEGTTVISDESVSYNVLDKHKEYVRLWVNHSVGQYSDHKGTYTNGIESVWALIKRGVYEMYHHISVKYMQEYIDEFCFRLNNWKNERIFDPLIGQCVL
ncbi:MAG: IS1595 family transposase [Methanocalculaceae archaeon]|nr:IS1595 family transposase [Methanocalculaceae archaeon]